MWGSNARREEGTTYRDPNLKSTFRKILVFDNDRWNFFFKCDTIDKKLTFLHYWMAKNEILSKFEKPRVHFRAMVNIQNCPTLIFKKDCLYLGHCNNHRSSRLSSPLIFELWLHNLRAMEKNCQELNNWIMCFLLFKSLLNNLFFFWIHTNLGTTLYTKNRIKGPIFLRWGTPLLSAKTIK